ncbi:Hypothetical predicted protein, partial [Pelobates cultripes]
AGLHFHSPIRWLLPSTVERLSCGPFGQSEWRSVIIRVTSVFAAAIFLMEKASLQLSSYPEDNHGHHYVTGRHVRSMIEDQWELRDVVAHLCNQDECKNSNGTSQVGKRRYGGGPN